MAFTIPMMTASNPAEATRTFGAHRLAAAQSIRRSAIMAVVYPSDYSDEQAKVDEIIENLHRADLTAEQRAVHQVAYAALLKKLNKVAKADTKRAASEKKTKAAKGVGGGGCDEPEVRHIAELPTVTERLSSDSDITPKAVRERHQTALRLAASEGVTIEGPNGVEAFAAETLEKVASAAGAALAKPRKPKVPKVAAEPKPQAELDLQDFKVVVKITAKTPEQARRWVARGLPAGATIVGVKPSRVVSSVAPTPERRKRRPPKRRHRPPMA